LVCRSGRAGRYHGAVLHSLHVPKDIHGPEGSIVEEVKKHGHALPRFELARDRDHCSTAHLNLLDWTLPLPPFFHLIGPAVDKLVAGLQTAALAMK